MYLEDKVRLSLVRVLSKVFSMKLEMLLLQCILPELLAQVLLLQVALEVYRVMQL